MADKTDGLTLAALQETAHLRARLLRAQLIGVAVLFGAMFVTPALSVTSSDADVDDVPLTLWSAVRYFPRHGHDHSEGPPTTFTLLTAGSVVAIVFAFACLLLAVILAFNRTLAAKIIVGLAVGLGVCISLFLLAAVAVDLPDDYEHLHRNWGLLLPAALGLWTANIFANDE